MSNPRLATALRALGRDDSETNQLLFVREAPFINSGSHINGSFIYSCWVDFMIKAAVFVNDYDQTGVMCLGPIGNDPNYSPNPRITNHPRFDQWMTTHPELCKSEMDHAWAYAKDGTLPPKMDAERYLAIT